MIWVLIFWALMALLIAATANQKGRSVFLWFVYAFLIWPVAAIHVLFLPSAADYAEAKARESGRVPCPHCAEMIKPAAKLCPFCKSDLTVETDTESAQKAVPLQLLVETKHWNDMTDAEREESEAMIARAEAEEREARRAPPVKVLADDLDRRLHVTYRAADGALTERVITVKQVYERGGEMFLKAYCHKVRATRNFRADRIEELEDMETGEVPDDPAEFIETVVIPEGAART